MKKMYTVGYSSYDLDSFVAMIKEKDIDAVTDVRSSPYSSYHSDFNQDNLKKRLGAEGIAYVFLGDLIGARHEDKALCSGGVVDFKRVAALESFKRGIARLRKGLESYSVAVMCAEKDPVTCHRMILICRNTGKDCSIFHILDGGKVETHREAEWRLMKKFGLEQPDLMGTTEDERLSLAYDRQGKIIAYKPDEDSVCCDRELCCE